MGVHDRPWLKANANRVKLSEIACVGYGHPDLVKTGKYMKNFGLVESWREELDGVEIVYYRGYGTQPVVYIARKSSAPEFLGAFYEAASEQELAKASNVPGASAVKDWICGGKIVDIVDPSGMPFHVVYGHSKRKFTPRTGEILPQNYPAASDMNEEAKPRRNQYHREFLYCCSRTRRDYPVDFCIADTDICLPFRSHPWHHSRAQTRSRRHCR